MSDVLSKGQSHAGCTDIGTRIRGCPSREVVVCLYCAGVVALNLADDVMDPSVAIMRRKRDQVRALPGRPIEVEAPQ